jgi:hypothetical protein
VPDIDIAKLDHERSFSEEEGDIFTEIVRSMCDFHIISILCSPLPGYSATISKATNADTPSKSAKSTGYRMYQHNLSLYDGRYDVNCPISTTAPPVQLFHPVFGHFLDDLADEKLDVPQEILDHRKPAIFPNLAAALHGHDEDCQSRSDLSGWSHIIASSG